MRTDVKTAWMTALRSGEHTQTTGALSRVNGGDCCLGVLSKVLVKEFPTLIPKGWEFKPMPNSPRTIGWVFENDIDSQNRYYLPTVIWKEIGGVAGQQVWFAQLNDRKRCTFDQIADHIREKI